MSGSPEKLFGDFEKILFDESTIRDRVSSLSEQINRAYADSELTVIAIANGALIFTADLIRKITLPIRLDCIRASSYLNQTKPKQSPEIISDTRLDIKGTNVLVIDDILDTGNTLLKISEKLRSMQPNSLKTCVLLDKKSRRSVDIEADFTGFEIPDEFVVGYGLDFAESYRQIPYIGVLKKKITQI
jgi:hypoxanthine phosphoribosyltransferase